MAIWMRIRFPNIIDVGYGASAPIFENYAVADPYFFFNKITSVVNSYDNRCPGLIRDAFAKIDITFEKNLDALSKQFNLCDALTADDKD